MTETRKLAAILCSDVVGFSRLAGSDEDRTLARLRTFAEARDWGACRSSAAAGQVRERRGSSAIDAAIRMTQGPRRRHRRPAAEILSLAWTWRPIIDGYRVFGWSVQNGIREQYE